MGYKIALHPEKAREGIAQSPPDTTTFYTFYFLYYTFFNSPFFPIFTSRGKSLYFWTLLSVSCSVPLRGLPLSV